MVSSKKNHLAEVSITGFSKNGQGTASLTRPDGYELSIEVPFSVPGDHVEINLFKRRKGITQSQLLKVIQPSPDRIEAKCIHFGECGGCRWQHLSYEQQLHLKEKWILEGLNPYIQPTTKIYPIIPCDPPWNYRNKAEFTFSTDKAMNRYLGFILHNSRGKVFNLKECHLVPAWMTYAVHLVQEWWNTTEIDAYHAMRDTGSLRTLTLREGQRTADKMIMLTVSGNADFALKNEHLKSFVTTLKENVQAKYAGSELSIFLRIQQVAKGQRTNFYEMQLSGADHICETMYSKQNSSSSLPFHFQISPTAFFQPNTQQAEKLYQKVVELSKLTADMIVYDLYCGTGTLGIFLARHVKEVHGIELCPESVIDAKENIKINHLDNVTIHQGDVAKILPILLAEKEKRPDLVIVDPPRAGLDNKALAHIIEINAAQIIYVSCNPATQALNVEFLVQAGYHLQAIQPVDQFPQTIHVENIICLVRDLEKVS